MPYLPIKNDDLDAIIKTHGHPLREEAYNLRKDMERLYERARSVQSTVEQVLRRLNAAHLYGDGEFHVGVNELGELQGRAATFEISCALVQRSEELFNRKMHELKSGE